jgi:hypothetical protein
VFTTASPNCAEVEQSRPQYAMSGIEIAGLILGAFPVLIYTLEKYREGAEALVDWWRIQRAYRKCRQDLQFHQILFEGNVERFLLPLVLDDDDYKHLWRTLQGRAGKTKSWRSD